MKTDQPDHALCDANGNEETALPTTNAERE